MLSYNLEVIARQLAHSSANSKTPPFIPLCTTRHPLPGHPSLYRGCIIAHHNDRPKDQSEASPSPSIRDCKYQNQSTYFPLFCASSFIPACTHLRLAAACSSIFALSFMSSLIVCGSGTWRPFSTAGRCNIRSSQALRAGNCSMSIPAQPAEATQPK